jgi:hypothetical protein
MVRARPGLRPAARGLALVVTAALAPSSGCLPEGDGPGIGRRLVETRRLKAVHLLSGGARGAPALHALFARAAHVPDPGGFGFHGPVDLFALAADGPARGAAPAPLARAAIPFRQPPQDAQGRLYLLHEVKLPEPGADSAPFAQLGRFDPATSERLPLGAARRLRLSPDGARLAYEAAGEDGRGRLVLRDTASGVERALGPSVTSFSFVGEDLVYVAGPEGTLSRLRADAPEPERLLERVAGFSVLAGTGGRYLYVLPRSTPGGSSRPGTSTSGDHGLLDLETGATRALPRAPSRGTMAVSGDGRRLAFVEEPTRTGGGPGPAAAMGPFLHVVTIETGAAERVPLPRAAPAGRAGSSLPAGLHGWPVFRPGSDEIWVAALEGLWIHRPGGPAEAVPRRPVLPFGGDGSAAPYADDAAELPPVALFTRDGRHYLRRAVVEGGDEYDDDVAVHLVPADDPLAEGTALTSVGTALTAFLDRGAAGLAFLAARNDEGADLYLTDAAGGGKRRLARGVHRALVAPDRILATVRTFGDQRMGDLVLLDVATGAETRLGPLVQDFAVGAGCRPFGGGRGGLVACEALAPGTPLAYAVHSARPSALDGLWMAALP